MKATKGIEVLILIVIIVSAILVATTKYATQLQTYGGQITETQGLANNIAAVSQRLDTIIMLIAIFIIAMCLFVIMKILAAAK